MPDKSTSTDKTLCCGSHERTEPISPVASESRPSDDVAASRKDERGAVELPYWCGRCGEHKVAERGHTCQRCKDDSERSAKMWASLRCRDCGEPAIGFNTVGAFCSNLAHYHLNNPTQGTTP